MEDFYDYINDRCEECKLYGDDEYINNETGEVVWACETCNLNPDNIEFDENGIIVC